VSLDAQKAKIAAWCMANDAILVEIFTDEGISGYTVKNRPALQQALAATCEHHGVLIVYSLSRLARNTRETLDIGEQLAHAGADLVSLSEKIDTTSAAGKMVFRMLAVLSEFERDQVSERTIMAMAHKRDQGQRISRRVPYGMQLATDGVHLEENPTEQATIALVRQYAARGISARQVAVKLAAKGHYSREGTTFAHSAILAMVRQE
jgi:DNA invertase Pin-like site-specific DNA recombinase